MWTPSATVVLGVALLLVVGWYLTFSATRLDRLHARMEGARAALETQLVRRASAALRIASSGRLDPATSLLLAGAAEEALHTESGPLDGTPGDGVPQAPGDPHVREQRESDLTSALAAAFPEADDLAALREDPVSRELLHELESACLRVQLSRRFLNDVVRSTRVVRRKKVIRYLRLAGHAPWPETFEMNDAPPGLLASSRR